MCTKVPSRSFGKYESFSRVQSFLPCLNSAVQNKRGLDVKYILTLPQEAKQTRACFNYLK